MSRKLNLALLLWPYFLATLFSAAAVFAYESRIQVVEWFHLERTNERDFACWVQVRPEVIIMGSSMPRLGVNPVALATSNGLSRGRVVTVARNGATPLQGYASYARNERMLGAAAEVFYSIEPWLLNDRYYRFAASERLIWSLAQWQLASKAFELDGGYFLPWANLLVNLWEPKEARRCRYKPGSILGHEPADHQRATWVDPYLLEAFDDMNVFGPSVVQVRYLGKLKRRVEANGGRFTLMLTPKHERYSQLYSQHPEYDAALRQLLIEELGADQRVLGRSVDPEFSGSREFFMDATHLSRTGAQRFSESVDLSRLSELPTLGSLAEL